MLEHFATRNINVTNSNIKTIINDPLYTTKVTADKIEISYSQTDTVIFTYSEISYKILLMSINTNSLNKIIFFLTLVFSNILI